MTAVALDVAFLDVRADQLRVRVGGPVPEPLVSAVVRAPGLPPLTLAVLGASHAVHAGDAAAPAFVEEVSCAAPGGVARAPPPAAGFPSRVRVLDEVEFAQVARSLRDRAEQAATRDDGETAAMLVAGFPGSPDALTAVAGEARPGGYRWRTWHLYPAAGGGGEVVETSGAWPAGPAHHDGRNAR